MSCFLKNPDSSLFTFCLRSSAFPVHSLGVASSLADQNPARNGVSSSPTASNQAFFNFFRLPRCLSTPFVITIEQRQGAARAAPLCPAGEPRRAHPPGLMVKSEQLLSGRSQVCRKPGQLVSKGAARSGAQGAERNAGRGKKRTMQGEEMKRGGAGMQREIMEQRKGRRVRGATAWSACGL